MSDILWLAIMRSEIRSPTTNARSPILLYLRRYPHRHEACITTHPIGNERMNCIVGEEIRFGGLFTPIDEAFVLARATMLPEPTIFSGSSVSGSERHCDQTRGGASLRLLAPRRLKSWPPRPHLGLYRPIEILPEPQA
jgi:hypothetical protein